MYMYTCTFTYTFILFGAVYMALCPALQQVQQVYCLLELFLELHEVPVRFSIVRQASCRMRLMWNVPVLPVMEYNALPQVCIVIYDDVQLVGQYSRPTAVSESCVDTVDERAR